MALSDYVREIYHCAKCALCTQAWGVFLPICPVGEKFGFEAYFAHGRMEVARGLLEGVLNAGNSPRLGQVIFSCVGCGGCEIQCYPITGIRPLKVIEALKSEAIERFLAPPMVREYLQNVHRYRNPWKMDQERRGDWAHGTGIRGYESRDEYLYFVDCVGSYDPRAGKAARALGTVLRASGVSFGILGSQESCSGSEVNALGEKGLFQFLAEQNIELFRSLRVQKIITLSPHAYHVFRNEYPRYGGSFEVLHYTQLLARLIREGRLKPRRHLQMRVTFHDPCFLGRRNGEYDAPREVLQAIPGVQLVEMERNRENAYCCGGGSANYFTDLVGGGEKSPARVRVREACATGAEVLVLACPVCMLMFEDAVKAEGLENRLAVRDLSEIVATSCDAAAKDSL